MESLAEKKPTQNEMLQPHQVCGFLFIPFLLGAYLKLLARYEELKGINAGLRTKHAEHSLF